MYKILVIDDQWVTRKPSYEILFKNSDGFELEFLQNGLKELSKIDNGKIDCIVLDLSLDYEGTNAKENFRLVLNKIKNKKPVILVSRKFTENAEWVKLPSEYGVKVIDYFGWNEKFTPAGKSIEDNLIEATIIRIKNSLDDYYNRSKMRKGLNESINILLLSDLQFGDPNFSDDTLLSEYNLSRYLIKNKIYPDLVFVAGDISFSASPMQFKQAEKWLKNLCDQLFVDIQNVHERIILVPGNHDVNLTLSTADYYRYDFKGIDEEKYLIPRKDNLNEYKTFGLYPFCDFAYKLTKDSKWIHKYNNLCWSNERFYNWGLRIMQLNTVSEMYYRKPRWFEINEDSIHTIVKNVDANSIDEVYTVFLAHNGPDDLGYNLANNNDKRVLNLFSLINNVGANLYLHGHRHKSSKKYKKEYAGNYTNEIDYSMCGTINVNIDRGPDTRRSFNLVELERENGKVINSNIRIFEIEDQEITEKMN
jgi:Icc-related predicted phosphoesterase